MQSTAKQIVSSNPFVGFFDTKKSQYEIDLSRSCLMDVLTAYEEHKRRVHPNYQIGSIKKHLMQIQVQSGHMLMPKDITDIFYATLSEYLVGLGVCYASQETYLSKIRTALEWGIRHGCQVSSTYDCIDIPRAEIFTIALTPDEVSHIAHFDCSMLKCRPQHRKTLERVRDMFTLSCALGQRHSDMVRITIKNFDRNIFKCIQQKTGNKARLDIDEFSMFPALTYRILKKYDYNAPYTAEIGNYNHYLHELLSLIGEEFDEEYKIERKVSGKIQTITMKKYELVASHTARRTFVTYNAFRQIPLAELSKATGHSQLSSLQKYIKYNNDD